MGLETHVVAGAVGVGCRLHDPVDVHADQMQQLAAEHGYFGGIDAVGAEHRATAALGALVVVHEPFLQHPEGHGTATGHLAEDLAAQGEVVAVYGTQEFGPENRHVLGIAGAQEEVALIRAGAATDTAIHEDFQGTEFIETLLQAIENDLFPALGQVPVVALRIPITRLTKQPRMAGEGFLRVVFNYFLFCGVGIVSRFECGRDIPPIIFRNSPCHEGWTLRNAYTEFVCFYDRHCSYSFSTGIPPSFMNSLNSSS